METWVDVGSPSDAHLESHLPPCPDDADFDAPALSAQDRGDHWDIIIAHDREIMALTRTIKALEEELVKLKALRCESGS